MSVSRNVLVIMALWSMLFAVKPSWADTFVTTGVLQGSTNFIATFDVDLTSGDISNWNVRLPAINGLPALTLSPGNSVLVPFTNPVASSCPTDSGVFGFASRSVPGWAELDFLVIVPLTTLAGFSGATIVPSVQCSTFSVNSAYVGIPAVGQSTLVQVSSGSIFPASPAATFLYVDNNPLGPNAISGFQVNPDGTVNPTPGSPYNTGGNGGGFGFFAANRIVVSSNALNSCVFASNDGTNEITSFQQDPLTGVLTFAAIVPFGADSQGEGISLAATANGQWLYAASFESDNVFGFAIDPNGSCALTRLPAFPIALPQGPDGMKTSADSNFLLIASLGAGNHGMLSVFAIDHTSGALTSTPGSPLEVRAAGGPTGQSAGVDMNCAEDTVVVGETGTMVDYFDFDSSTGITTIRAGSPFTFSGADSPQDVQFSADDSNLYLSNAFSSSITQLATNPADGFTLLGTVSTGGNMEEPSNLATDGFGYFVVSANRPNSISIFVRNPMDGTLTLGSHTVLANTSGVMSVAITPSKCNN